MKKYQKTSVDRPEELEVSVPERVSAVMAEIAGNMQEGLLALAVGAGLQVMSALMDADVTGLAGPKGRHDAARTAARHRARLGDAGRPAGGRRATAGPGRGRLGGTAGAGV